MGPGPAVRGLIAGLACLLAGSAAAQDRAPLSVTEAWRRLGAEPSVHEVQEAVRSRERRAEGLRGLAVRSRWSHALPSQVVARVQTDDEDRWSGTLYDDEGWRQNRTGNERLLWRVEARWDLSRLVYDPQELAVARARLAARERRWERVDLATRLYFERRDAQLEYLTAPVLTVERTRQLWTRIAALTARLDALTGGLYTRRGLPTKRRR